MMLCAWQVEVLEHWVFNQGLGILAAIRSFLNSLCMVPFLSKFPSLGNLQAGRFCSL